MAWKIELDRSAERELDKLDPPTARRILSFLHGRVALLDDPRGIGEALNRVVYAAIWQGSQRLRKIGTCFRHKPTFVSQMVANGMLALGVLLARVQDAKHVDNVGFNLIYDNIVWMRDYFPSAWNAFAFSVQVRMV